MSFEWRQVSLKEVTSILGDGLHGTPEYDPNGHHFFINGNNLNNGKIVLNETTKRVSEAESKKYKKNLTDRTILVSIILDSSVERARVGYWRRVWVGVTTLQATACNEEQHPQTCRQ
jgi:hypothetical protein